LAVIAAALGVLLPLALRSGGSDYLEVDAATGLHMTGTPTEVDIAAYRLTVTGNVDKATWSGVPFKTILESAAEQPSAGGRLREMGARILPIHRWGAGGDRYQQGGAMSRRLTMIAIVLAALLLAMASTSCSGGQDTGSGGVSASTSTDSAGSGSPTTISTTTTIIALEDLEPVVQPTLPAKVPGYLQVDPATGLHMTGTPTVVDLATYRLKVSGKVDHELSLTYDQIRALPRVTASPELVCPGYFADDATWTGVPLKTILDMAGVQPDATEVIMKSADGYSTGTHLETALESGGFLAYELDGRPLPVLQGFPLRAVFPGEAGGLWAKWLTDVSLM
jgi:DMSO/TMAO reductase YedYZ molybdopterin-dependent catalytic subunit